MRLRTKIFIGALLLLLVSGGIVYYLNSKDHYDPTKYSATISDGLETGGLETGSRVELTLPDQFDVSHTIGPETTTLILAFSKSTGGTVRGYLDKQEADFLRTHSAIFIADISSFPVVLRNTIALPKLRESPYSVLLLYEEAMADSLKNKAHADEITIATLRDGIVEDVKYLSSEAELETVFR